MIYNRLNPWGKQRELPMFPEQSFRAMLKDRQKAGGHGKP
jgi:L-lactate dehydrogenase complex protein LldF